MNALLFPYLNNAMRLLEEQVASMEGIDAAMTGGCGFPMGPFALLDLVGLDTSLAILEALHAERGDPSACPSPLLRRHRRGGPARPQVRPRLLRLPSLRTRRGGSRDRARHAVADADVLGALERRGQQRAVPRRTSPRARPASRSPSTCRPRPGYDPDAPEARGEVGRVGVPVVHLGHMERLFEAIPIESMNTSMTINATAPWLLGLYLALADAARASTRRSCRARRRTTS